VTDGPAKGDAPPDGARGPDEAGPLSPRAPTGEGTARVAALLDAVEGAERVLVLTHDNPDPDAIASAAGLGFLLERTAPVETVLAFGGIVGRAENRALIGELDVEFARIDTLDLDSGVPVALVDTQPRAGNNSLPDGRIATVVVDHHPLRAGTGAAIFADVRPGIGASCTILTEYLRAVRLEPPRRLATALFYGIQSETMDLGREVSTADVSASLHLYPRSDPGSISRIRHARVPQSYFRSMHHALERARRHGGVLCVPMGRLDYPDMVAEVADLFMRVEGVEWTITSGRYRDDLLLSVRTYGRDAHAGELVRHGIGERGSAGGHGSLAGAQVPIRGMGEEEVARLVEEIYADLLGFLGVAATPGEPIIPPRDGSGDVERVRGTGE